MRSIADFAPRGRLLPIALLAAVAFATVSLGNTKADTAKPVSLKIGSAVSLSGELASIGKTNDAAARMAAKYIMESAKAAGMEADVSVATEDTQSRAAPAAEAVTKLVKADKADVIIGPATTGETIPAFQTGCLPNGIPMLTMASSPTISTVDGAGKLLFRTTPSDRLQAKYLVRLAQEAFKPTSTINIGVLNNAPGNAFAEIVSKAWEAGGGKVGKVVKWNADQPTYETEAQKLAEGDPAGWMIYDFPGSWQKFLPALVRTGKWDPAKTFGGDPLADIPSEIGTKMAGLKVLNIGSKPGKNSDDFNKLWEKETGLELVYGEAQTFDAALLAFLAKAKGVANNTGIAENLRAVSGPEGTKFDWQKLPDALKALQSGQPVHLVGATGEFNFDDHGDVSGAFYNIFEWTKDGKKIIGSVGE